MAGENINRRLSIYINDREVVNSLSGIEREMGKVQRQMKALNHDSEDYDQQLAQLADTYNQLSKRQKDYSNEIKNVKENTEKATMSAEQAQSAFASVFDGISSGNVKQVQEGLSSISTGLWGAVKAGFAFAATPFGFLTILAGGLITGAKALFDYNSGLTEMNKKLTSLGVNALDLSSVRSEIKATADTFDKTFDEIAEKANSLSKSYKISITEANDIIARGLANGGAQNSEFLDSIGEYDEFFARAGYSAQSFIDLVNTGYEKGTYADKLPDALKEANLALEEQTETTKDALVNAFGASFSDDILAKVSSGELTTKQALDQISQKAKESNLNQQQYAQLTADLFKGAGEDAGGAAVIFDLLTESSNRAMSTTASNLDKLRLANERLEKATANAFEVNGFEDAWLSLKIMAIDTISSIIEEFSDFKQQIQPIIDLVGVVFVVAWENLKSSVAIVWEVISSGFKLISNGVRTFVNVFKKVLDGDFKGAFQSLIDGFVNVGVIIGNVFIGVKNSIISNILGIVDAITPVLSALGVNVDKLKKKLESWKSQKFELRGVVNVDRVTRNPNDGNAPERSSGSAIESEDSKKEKIKAAQEHKKIIEQQLKDQEALDKQLLQTRRAAEDAKIAIMQDGFEKEKVLINTDYNRKIEDLKSQLIKESELKKLQENINSASASGNTSEVSRLQKILDSKIEINKNYNQSISSAEESRLLKIAKLEEKYLEIHFKKEAEKHARELQNLKTKQNFELQEITSFQQAKAFLSNTLSGDELKHVRTLEQAKKLIKEQHLKEQYELEKQYLQNTIQELQAILQNGEASGFSIFTDEERDKVLSNLEQVQNKLSNLDNPSNSEGGDGATEQNAFDSSTSTGVDILGFDAGKWEVLFEGLDTFKEKVEAITMVSQALQNAFGQYFAFMEAGENRTLAAFQKTVDKKRAENQRLLDRGYIDQEVYNARMAKSEEELNRKKAELEYKQAKRKKAMSIVEAVMNTATAIMQAYAQLGPIGGTVAAAVIGTLGALQIATIAKQPLPEKGFKKGGHTGNVGVNEVAGVVHGGEYVVPNDVLTSSDPRVPAVLDFLEAKRTGKSTESNTDSSVNMSSLSSITDRELLMHVLEVVENNTDVMERIVEGEISAYIELDVKSAKQIRDKIRQLETIENNR